ncbi:MAG: response regulator [bacterium]
MKNNAFEILVVEDNLNQLLLLKKLLERNDYRVSVAYNGREALELLDERKLDLVISDIVMPVMDGYELCRRLKHDEKLNHIPVILLTRLSEPEDMIRGLKCGADHFIAKPYDLNHLLQRIDDIRKTIDIRKGEQANAAVKFHYAGSSHAIDADRRQVIDLLISTYEHAVQQNHELVRVQLELTALNQKLEDRTLQLEASETNYRTLLETNADAIVVADRDGIVKFVNPAVEEMFGSTREKLLGKPFEYSLRAGETQEVVLRRTQGKARVAEMRVVETDWQGRTAFLASLRDITDHKSALEALRKAKMAAEAATRAKSEFLANMSHEIRTPLNAVIGMTELTLDTKLTPEQHEYLKVVHASSEALLCLISDILDFSKIEAGQIELETTHFDFREQVESVAETLSVRAASKGLELLCFVDPSLPGMVVGDPTRLRQVLVNLLGNAIKFTEKGEVSVKVEPLEDLSVTAEDDGSIGLHFMVSDTGVGISKQQQEKVFEKFTQADTSTTRTFGGTGLGLSISRSLIELMGGRLWLESELGKGSTFHFALVLPRGEAEKKQAGIFKHLDFKRLTILVVDDNRTSRTILEKTLQAWGFRTLAASNGAAALSLLQKRRKPVDLVILDHQMPKMDGVEVARTIRGDARLKDTPIIMQSSMGDLNATLQAELQIAQFMTKPIRQTRLFDVLLQVLGFREAAQPETPEPEPLLPAGSQSRSQRILLVEDNVDNQNLAKRMLAKAGFYVEVADNGREAVTAASKSHYDLIFMDVQMPVMDGFRATHEIRAVEREAGSDRVPIIALTAHALKGYREKCLANEMDDYMTKPLKKQILLEKVNRWIGAEQRRR